MGHLRFDIDHPNFREAPRGSTLVLRSPEGSEPEWRCQVRLSDKGWDEVIRIEIGPPSAGGLNAALGRGIQDRDPADRSLKPLSEVSAASAVEAAFRGALDFQASAEVAQTLRRWRKSGRAPEDAFGEAVAAQVGLKRLAVDDPQVIASLYARLVEHGVRDPTARLAALLGVSRPTLSRRIATARRKGYLGPPQKGKAGSASFTESSS